MEQEEDMGHDMILIGQYDSPFVRRVAVALQVYRLPYEHRPWSVWRDAAEIAPHNPLRRVPTLIIDGNEALVDSAAILDALDDMVEPERALVPRTGPSRRRALRVCALACGAGDKAVSLLYESLLRDQPSAVWTERCRAQIAETFDLLEAERQRSTAPFWLGDSVGHADVAVACVLRFTAEAHGEAFDLASWPLLRDLASRCEARPEMQAVVQPLTVTLSKAT
jgi:glutathione S-transferase